MNMKNNTFKMMAASLLVVMAGHAVAQEQSISCSYKGKLGWTSAPELTLKRSCSDLDTLMEACSGFTISAADKKVPSSVYKIPTEKSGTQTVLKFKPTDVNVWDETIGGDGFVRWAVSLVDNSGGNAAEERYLILEDGTFKPLTKFMTYAQFEAWKKEGAKANGDITRKMGTVAKTCK